MQSKALQCRECGLDYPEASPRAHCPNCLLNLALSIGDDSNNSHLPAPGHQQFFAGYEIYEEIARGGVGIVYRARQLSPSREVALKRLQAGALATAETRMRFEMEIGAVAKLSHPGIVSLCESGEERGELFFSMTYLPGGSLADTLRNEPNLPNYAKLRERIQFFLTVCDAVHHAHQRGVLHRDIKPSNIIFNEDGDPVVTDFGLVKMLEADSNLTLSQTFIGSPNYMAPEQASGDAANATIATDIYGLGAVLYELTTGQPPFLANTPMETMRMAAEQPPKSLCKINPAVGKDLEQVCLKCIEKKAIQRYPSVEELAADLRRWLRHQPVRARPRPLFVKALLWCRRHPAIATAISAVVITLTIVLIISIRSSYQIATANNKTAQLLVQMQLEKTETFFQQDHTNEGLAMLAHVLQTTPNNRELIAHRLYSKLANTSFAIQDAKPNHIGIQLLAVSLSPDGKTALSISRDGIAKRWDIEHGTGGDADVLFEMKQMLLEATTSPDGRSVWSCSFDRELSLSTERGGNGIKTYSLGKVSHVHEPAFDKSGRFAIAIVNYRELHVWDCEAKGKLVHKLGNGSVLQSWATTPDNNLTAAGTNDGTLLVWSLETGNEPRSLHAHPGHNIAKMSFDQSGSLLATITTSGHIKIWNTQTWNGITMEGVHGAPPTSLEFSPDGSSLITASFDKTARIWDTRTGKEKIAPLRHEHYIFSAKFSSDGTKIATASEDSSARIWNASTGKPITPRIVHDTGLKNVFFIEGSDRLLTATFSGFLLGWKIHPPFSPIHLLENGAEITSVAFAQEKIVGGGKNGEIGVWNATTGKTLSIQKKHASRVTALAIDPEEKYYATASDDQSIWVSPLSDISADQSYRLQHPSQVNTLAFSPNQSHLLTGSQDGRTRIWDWINQKNTVTTAKQEGPVTSVTFLEDRDQFISLGPYQFALKNASNGENRTPPKPSAALFSGFELIPNKDKLIVFASRTICSFDASNFTEKRSYTHSSQILSHDTSKDGTLMLTGCADGVAYLWSWNKKEELFLLNSFKIGSSVTAVSFSEDNSMIFTGGDSGYYRLWSLISGQPLTELRHHHRRIDYAHFSADSYTVLISGRNGGASLIPVNLAPSSAENWLPELTHILTKTQVSDEGSPKPILKGSYHRLQTQRNSRTTAPLFRYFFEQ